MEDKSEGGMMKVEFIGVVVVVVVVVVMMMMMMTTTSKVTARKSEND